MDLRLILGSVVIGLLGVWCLVLVLRGDAKRPRLWIRIGFVFLAVVFAYVSIGQIFQVDWLSERFGLPTHGPTSRPEQIASGLMAIPWTIAFAVRAFGGLRRRKQDEREDGQEST